MTAGMRVVCRVPVAGWLLKDAVLGAEDAKYWFVFNMLCLFGVGLYFIGYPLLITYALTATVLAFTYLIMITLADTIDVFRGAKEP